MTARSILLIAALVAIPSFVLAQGMPMPMGPGGGMPMGPPGGMPMSPGGMPPMGPGGMPMSPGGMPMGPGGNMPMGPGASTPAGTAFMTSMLTMMKDLFAAPTGDPDKDFVAIMIPLRQGTIDMAKIQLQHGKDPMLRDMAQKIIKAQEEEIAALKKWQADKAK